MPRLAIFLTSHSACACQNAQAKTLDEFAAMAGAAALSKSRHSPCKESPWSWRAILLVDHTVFPAFACKVGESPEAADFHCSTFLHIATFPRWPPSSTDMYVRSCGR